MSDASDATGHSNGQASGYTDGHIMSEQNNELNAEAAAVETVVAVAEPESPHPATTQAPDITDASITTKSWTPQSSTRKAKKELGLKFERHFTRAGEDPFNTVEWELRTAGITGEDGKVVFEQRDCEIPKTWSQLATNVVVSKYFRGRMDSPQRETSVRQVIGRVADTFGRWGREGGYFASDEDASAFRDELVYLLLHQYGSFNSPVWFNIGVKGAHQQASACQPYDAFVATPSGLVPIGKLVEDNAVGTLVFDAKGVARIVATKCNGTKRVLRLHTKAGYTLDVTGDHLVWKATGTNKGTITGKFVEAGTLQTGDQLCWHRTPSIDKSQEMTLEAAEAALAGWLQSDGFVGQYETGTNRSLTVEAMVVCEEEERWVRALIERVLPNVHSHTREVETKSTDLQCRRIRLYGEALRPFVEKWNLLVRREEMRVPSSLFTAPLGVAAAYLRSLFQAEGYVSVRENAVVGLDMISDGLVRDAQLLLGRFSIYARVRPKKDAREDRVGCTCLSIRTLGDRERFAQEIGFLSTRKLEQLQASLQLKGLRSGDAKRLKIESIEDRGEMPVYDIQTTSGEYLSGNIRVHNCFINSVHDNMESIMELAATEARLFKGGSGAGSNLSRIRSSKEHLSGGGIASGPVSFMRGWDAFAGAIKSGGTTRRAAKMVILNADHPDIEEFISAKAVEEKKAWALIEAGYNGGFNVPGGAYDSVDFQNANHSVRASDEFMRAADNNAEWSTRSVTTGEVMEKKNAREMLRAIAEATHICGDPGMQYDTTINDWHTSSNTDRIYASNPCSEFLYLDDTACVAGKTRISTPDGLRTAEELWQAQQSGETVHVTTDLHSEHDHRRLAAHRRAHVTRIGEREVFQVRLADGRRVRATGDHRFLCDDGRWRRVDEMRTGLDRVQVRHSGNTVAFNSDQSEVARWRMLGWMSGDGVFSQDNVALVFGAHEAATAQQMEREFYRLIEEAHAHRAFAREETFEGESSTRLATVVAPPRGCRVGAQPNGVLQITSKSQALVSYLQDWYGMKQGTAIYKDVPTAVHRVADDLKVAYLQGLFSADGCIRHDPRANEEVMLASSSPEMLRSIQLMLSDLGITSRISWTHPAGRKNAQGQLHIYNRQARTFLSLVGFPCSTAKDERARAILNTSFKGISKNPRPSRVLSVEPDGRETVYDITEPVTHSFIAEGLITHNCNLASMNLMKFRQQNGEFDSELFVHASEVFITAQEIIVSNASYPTEKIAKNSEKFRPLGLGYANLGALLMAQGTAYDSDEGRALAGAITAIMTGAAYRQSAKIAANIGTFEGYKENREPMLRVIGKHRDAVSKIPRATVPFDTLNTAQRVWDEALVLGQKHGFRNAQATVLAPTGCLVDSSLISTDRGLVRLKRLGDTDGQQWQDIELRVWTDEGVQQATKFYVNGVAQTRKVQTQAGYTIQGTHKHRVKVVTASGAWEWKRFDAIEEGDVVPLAMNTLTGEAREVVLAPLGDIYWTGDFNTRVPRTMTPELAELAGYFMGDGSLHAKGLRFCVADADVDVVERIRVLVAQLFGLTAHVSPQTGYQEVVVHSVPLTVWWEACGLTKQKPNEAHSGKGYVPHIPDCVLHANDAIVYNAFLRGLFEADGTLIEGVPSFSTAHESFAGEVRSLLLGLGYPTTSKVGASGWGSRDLHSLRLRNGGYNVQFRRKIGFMGARKQDAIADLKGALSGKRDRIYLPMEVIEEVVPRGSAHRDAVLLSLRHHGALPRQRVVELYAQSGDERLLQALGYFYDTVESNQDGGEQPTYDLSVPHNVTYVANGFISHNTIAFMMDCDTTGIEPDIALVKYKKLVGGGLLKIVNQTVPEALQKLGYSSTQSDAIIDYIDKNDTIEGAPGLKEAHLPVFDCAFKAQSGTRSIHYMGHIRMMSAAQPFISGAISKTVNVPSEASVDDILQAYMESWKLGLKAVAIYRDGSKRTQPLSTTTDAKIAEAKEARDAPRALRRKLPDERHSITHKFSIAGQEGYFTVGLYEDGSPGEIFIKMSKEGSTISGLMDSFAVAISMCLQYGVPLRVLVNKFSHSRFEPSGYTTNKEIPIAKSLMDYIFRWFDLRFHPNGSNGHLGKEAHATPTGAGLSAGSSQPALMAAPEQIHDSHPHDGGFHAQTDAPPCTECGTLMIRAGACYKCPNCGTTSGCG